MAWHYLFNNIATLASMEYQEKYVIGGTAEEFLSIDDLIHDFLGSAEWAKHHANSHKFPPPHLAAIDELYNFLRAGCYEALDAKSFAEVGPLMRDRPIWVEIRTRAAETLSLLGISTANVPVEDLDEYEWEYLPKIAR
ncbi:MAG: hypothetical protein ABL928_14485 [Sphingorhabdus sp.]